MMTSISRIVNRKYLGLHVQTHILLSGSLLDHFVPCDTKQREASQRQRGIFTGSEMSLMSGTRVWWKTDGRWKHRHWWWEKKCLRGWNTEGSADGKWVYQELACAPERQFESPANGEQTHKTKQAETPGTGLTHPPESCLSAFSPWW